MPAAQPTKRSEMLAFLKSHAAGVLATASPEGKPHASAVYYAADDNFNLYFFTLLNSRKFAAIQGNPNVAFTVGTLDVPQTLQIEGVAIELRHEDEMAHVSDLVRALTSNSTYYAPITRLNPSETVLVWIKPTWIRWADYTSPESGSKNIFTEIPV
jgi:nitroimidazol reductase NimA-like FMN-containing flavoprotein (pyridoxamine 5'-phosphate oxidase superfamily)